jgi:hypothetical protein
MAKFHVTTQGMHSRETEEAYITIALRTLQDSTAKNVSKATPNFGWNISSSCNV